MNIQQLLPLAHVPDSDAFVLRVAEDEFLSRVEQTAGHVVIVTTAGVHLPRLGIYNTHPHSHRHSTYTTAPDYNQTLKFNVTLIGDFR